MDSAGDFVVAWTDYSGLDGSGDGIFAQRYNSGGSPVGSEFQVNTYTPGNQSQSSVAMDATGDFVIAWTDYSGEDGSDTGVFAQSYNAAGVPQGSQFQVNTYTTGYQKHSSVAMDAAGDFVVTWTEYNGEDGNEAGIFAQRYNASGSRQGSEFQVNTSTTFEQELSSVAMDSAGDFVVAWRSNQTNVYHIYAQRFSSSGAGRGQRVRGQHLHRRTVHDVGFDGLVRRFRHRLVQRRRRRQRLRCLPRGATAPPV